MQAQVKTWGNSQGIRIPKEVLQEANVKINDVLDVRVADGMIMLVKPFRHKTLEERAARMLLVNRVSFSGMGDAGSLSKDQFCDFSLDKLQIIYQANRLLQRMEIYNVSFEETMKYADDYNEDEVFIFLDPPYYKQESSGLYGKNGNTHHGFPHEKFAEETRSKNCKWFVTYDDSTFVRRMFNGRTKEFYTTCKRNSNPLCLFI